jgi:signal transduction histidine kinase
MSKILSRYQLFLTVAFFVFIFIIGLFGILFLFSAILDTTGDRLESVIRESLDIEIDEGDITRASVLFKNLEKNHSIYCVELKLSSLDGHLNLYSSSSKVNCDSVKIFFLPPKFVNNSILSSDGREWIYSFGVNYPQEFAPLLFIIVGAYLFIILLIFIVVFLNLKQESILRDRIDLHIRGIAHDLMSPLGALKIFGKRPELLRSEKGFRTFSSALDRIVYIVETIKHRNGIVPSVFNESFDPVYCLTSILNEKKSDFDSNGIKVEMFFDEGINNCVCVGSLQEFSRCLSNIFNNAIEELSSSVTDSEKKISIKLNESANNLDIILSDNGPGFPADKIDLIGKKTVASVKKGNLGIGLLLVGQTVGRWGGKLSVRNSEYGGAIVVVSLLRSNGNI